MDKKEVKDCILSTQHALVVELKGTRFKELNDVLDRKVMSMYKEGVKPDPYWHPLSQESILFVGTLNQVAEFKTWIIKSNENINPGKSYVNN